MINKKLFIGIIITLFLVSSLASTVQAQTTSHIYLYVGYGSVTWRDLTAGTQATVELGFHNLQFVNGHHVTLTAENTVANYGFSNWIIQGEQSGNTSVNPFDIIMGSTFTCSAYFVLTNNSLYSHVTVANGTGGTVFWIDNTNPNPLGMLFTGEYDILTNDILTFTASPTKGYVFDHFTITNSEFTQDVKNTNPMNLTVLGNFSITAYFAQNLFIPDSITLESFATDNGYLVLNLNINYDFIFSCTESTDVNPDGNIAPNPQGNYTIELSAVQTTPFPPIDQLNNSVAFTKYSGGTVYNGEFYNEGFGIKGNLDFDDYLLMRVTVNFLDGHSTERIFNLKFLANTPKTIPIDFFGISGNTIGAIVIFVVVTFGLTYLTRKWYPMAGLLTGVVISLIICGLLKLIDIWVMFLCALLLAVILLLLIRGREK